MALASTELAAALDHFATVTEANVQAKAEADAEVQYCLESMQAAIQFEPIPDFWIEPLPLIHTPPVVGPVWNPAPPWNTRHAPRSGSTDGRVEVGHYKPSPSLLDLDVRLSPHPAPDVLGIYPCHVDIIMTAFVDCLQVLSAPILMVTISMVQMNSFVIYKFLSA